MSETIKLVHGDGGRHTQKLIHQLFYKYFNNEQLLQGLDAAVLWGFGEKLAFTTDSFVVKPQFFSGGNIGKLAVCGTINDLVVSGAMPEYLSAGFIIEEGFPMQRLEEIVKSMSDICKECGVKVVTGDTKVVEKGSADGVFINTSGIGSIIKGYETKPIEAGDKIIVTGGIGEHGTAIALERYDIKVKVNFKSDCAPLFPFLGVISKFLSDIKIMRDPTRGGLAAVLHEFSDLSGLGVHLMEEDIPVNEGIKVVNQMLGLDPMYMACEGRMVLVARESKAQNILEALQAVEQGKEARIIGKFTDEIRDNIFIENYIGGRRILSPLEGTMLPRIC